MAKPGENIVKKYLEGKGLKAVKIPERDIKTVDFAVYSANELVFYLEEKTLALTPLKWKNIDPIYNAIAKDSYEAAKQFKSINPDRRVPNVLAFVNMDPAKSVNFLFATLTGHVITAGGKLRWINKMKSTEKGINLIDLYLWFDNDQLSGHIWEDNNPGYEAKLTGLLGWR